MYTRAIRMKVFVSYKRDHAESEALLSLLETELRSAHTTIYSDRLLTAGEWRPKLLEWIDGCDLFVVLLSERSLESEEIRDEVHRAYDRWLRTGRKRPTIIPVSVNYSGPLGGFKRDLSAFQGLRWTGEGDDDTLPNKIREEVRRKRRPKVYGAAIAALLLVVVLLYSFAPASLRDLLKPRTPSSEGRPDSARVLSVRQITHVNDVIAVAVSPDAKTVFINRLRDTQLAGVYITDVNGAPPRKLFNTFGGTIACGKANCYLSGVIDEKPGVYRFSAHEAPVMLFSGSFGGIDIHPAGDRLLLTRSDGETQTFEIVVRRIDDGSQTVERSSRGWMNNVSHASWHPDGKSILYAESGREAVLHDLSTGKRVSLPKASAWISRAAWETRGIYSLALSGTATGSEFWMLHPKGQPIGPVLRDEVWFNDLRATSLPDTFSAVRVVTHALPQLASLGPKAVTRAIAPTNLTGPFSWADPEHLVYVAKDGTGTWIEEYDIYAHQVRRLSRTASFRDAAMTPDGARLVFSMATDTDPEYGLWTSPVDRWNPVKLAQLPTTYNAISPDSKWVTFAAFGPEGGLYVTSINSGGDVRRLMRGAFGQVSFAGPQTILFLRNLGDRQTLCKISRDAGPESCFAPEEVNGFAVSPDRKTVAAVTSTQNHTRLHFIDIASGVVGKVVTVPGSVDASGGIAWTTGDSRIVYVTSTGFHRAVEAYRIADGANEVVSKSAEEFVRHVSASPDGRHAVFLRERSSSDAVLLTVTP
jgi:Tol biopolymer transport system component